MKVHMTIWAGFEQKRQLGMNGTTEAVTKVAKDFIKEWEGSDPITIEIRKQ